MAKEATNPKPSMQRECYCLAVHKNTREHTVAFQILVNPTSGGSLPLGGILTNLYLSVSSVAMLVKSFV